MATNWIPINTNQRLGADLRRTIDSLRGTIDQVRRLKDIMDQQISNGSDYSEIDTQFGTPTGEGQTVYNLIAGLLAALLVNNVTQPLDWLG